MGVVPSTPRNNSRPQDTAEFLIASFVGEKSFPLSSDFWKKLLEIPLTLQWPQERILQACQAFAQNNCRTGHLAKILVHLVWCLQESMSSSGVSIVYSKTINAAYISAVFMKYVIEKSESDNFEELNLCLHESDATHPGLPEGQSIENFVMHGVLTFIGTIDVSSHTYALHHELLNLLLVALSTQLCSRASPGPNDMHPFLDAAMSQDSTLVSSVVLRLLQNYIVRPYIPQNEMSYAVFSKGKQPGVLQKVGTVAATFVLLPYYTFNYLLSTSGDGLRSSLADNSLLVLLVLVHHQKLIMMDGDGINKVESDMNESIHPKELSCFYDNPYRKALENARDIEFDRVDIEGNAHNGPIVRLPFASLFDTLGMFLADESSVLLLYSLLHGNSDFLEYVLVRTDLDTLLMPILETLYNASKKTSNQIYMLLIILLILSQDSSFNASIHKLILPSIPWYKERLLHNTSLGSLTVIVLIRTVKYNLSKLRDIYLHTNCLATLANMAPHVHKLSAYASQRLVSLFDMLSRKYAKLADLMNDKMLKIKVDSETLGDMVDDTSTELHIYTDFLRIVLEILNSILTYALPRNPEVVYAIMHRQEVFLPFKCHPRFNELLENIYTVLDFFNSRMDAQQVDGEWSVEKVLQVIINNCRSWRGDGLKMFTQLRFTYEQENHPEEFFIPYVWQLILIHSNFSFDPNAITLFPTELPVEVSPTEDVIRVGNLEV